MTKETKSSFSFKGWIFVEWLKGNLKTIKEIVKVGVPLIVSMWASNDVALQVLIVAAGKLLLDTVEYIVKPRTL